MNLELLRLATFSSWPETAKASPIRLAKAGLYFNGQGDTTVCFRCSSLLDKWKEGDDPLERHRLRALNCPLTHGDDKENVPLTFYFGKKSSSIASRSSPDEVDSATLVNSSDQRCQTISLLSVYSSALCRARKRAVFSSQFIDRTNPDFDNLRRESVRLSTFHDWPPKAHAQPAELARYGFFFTGLDDRVQCAFCRGVLRHWVPGDKPRKEHRMHFPECPFVRRLDVGNVSVEANEELGLTKVCYQLMSV